MHLRPPAAVFSSLFSGTSTDFLLPLEWKETRECTIFNASESPRVWSDLDVLDCLEVDVWGGGCDVPTDSILWNGNEVLDCLGYTPNTALRNGLITLIMCVLIRMLQFGINKYQFRNL